MFHKTLIYVGMTLILLPNTAYPSGDMCAKTILLSNSENPNYNLSNMASSARKVWDKRLRKLEDVKDPIESRTNRETLDMLAFLIWQPDVSFRAAVSQNFLRNAFEAFEKQGTTTGRKQILTRFEQEFLSVAHLLSAYRLAQPERRKLIDKVQEENSYGRNGNPSLELVTAWRLIDFKGSLDEYTVADYKRKISNSETDDEGEIELTLDRTSVIGNRLKKQPPTQPLPDDDDAALEKKVIIAEIATFALAAGALIKSQVLIPEQSKVGLLIDHPEARRVFFDVERFGRFTQRLRATELSEEGRKAARLMLILVMLPLVHAPEGAAIAEDLLDALQSIGEAVEQARSFMRLANAKDLAAMDNDIAAVMNSELATFLAWFSERRPITTPEYAAAMRKRALANVGIANDQIRVALYKSSFYLGGRVTSDIDVTDLIGGLFDRNHEIVTTSAILIKDLQLLNSPEIDAHIRLAVLENLPLTELNASLIGQLISQLNFSQIPQLMRWMVIPTVPSWAKREAFDAVFAMKGELFRSPTIQWESKDLEFLRFLFNQPNDERLVSLAAFCLTHSQADGIAVFNWLTGKGSTDPFAKTIKESLLTHIGVRNLYHLDAPELFKLSYLEKMWRFFHSHNFSETEAKEWIDVLVAKADSVVASSVPAYLKFVDEVITKLAMWPYVSNSIKLDNPTFDDHSKIALVYQSIFTGANNLRSAAMLAELNKCRQLVHPLCAHIPDKPRRTKGSRDVVVEGTPAPVAETSFRDAVYQKLEKAILGRDEDLVLAMVRQHPDIINQLHWSHVSPLLLLPCMRPATLAELSDTQRELRRRISKTLSFKQLHTVLGQSKNAITLKVSLRILRERNRNTERQDFRNKRKVTEALTILANLALQNGPVKYGPELFDLFSSIVLARHTMVFADANLRSLTINLIQHYLEHYPLQDSDARFLLSLTTAVDPRYQVTLLSLLTDSMQHVSKSHPQPKFIMSYETWLQLSRSSIGEGVSGIAALIAAQVRQVPELRSRIVEASNYFQRINQTELVKLLKIFQDRLESRGNYFGSLIINTQQYFNFHRVRSSEELTDYIKRLYDRLATLHTLDQASSEADAAEYLVERQYIREELAIIATMTYELEEGRLPWLEDQDPLISKIHLGFDIWSYDPVRRRARKIEVKSSIGDHHSLKFTEFESSVCRQTAASGVDDYFLNVVNTADEEGFMATPPAPLITHYHNPTGIRPGLVAHYQLHPYRVRN